MNFVPFLTNVMAKQKKSPKSESHESFDVVTTIKGLVGLASQFPSDLNISSI